MKRLSEVIEIYRGSDAGATKALYADLATKGARGVIATNLFRAQKCSERAKVYRGHRYKDAAYERKNYSMNLLCASLAVWAERFGMRWGWKADLSEPFAPWVLYVDLPQGQVSFHSRTRGEGPDYAGEWDGATGSSPIRIISFTATVLERLA